MPTPHIEAKENEIAETVLMPGDPLRAQFIAETYLENPIKFNNVRGMLGYTGTYKGKKVSVMGSGMGMPSIGIYSYELFKFYNVKRIIRVGSCGAYSPDLKLYDIILTTKAYSESTFAKTLGYTDEDTIFASEQLNKQIKDVAKGNIYEGCVHSSDVFYRLEGTDYNKLLKEKSCIAVEMESFALFANAKALNKEAACLLTVSDSFVTNEATTSEERQKSFTKMILLALDAS